MGLKEQAVRGVTWTSIGTLGAGVLNLLITIILARLLTPTDFGIIELLVVFSTVSDIIVDSGFSQAIIRDNYANERDLSSVFWLNIGIAAILYMVLFFFSPYIANFYDSAIMENLSKIVFLTIIFNSLAIVQNANLSRTLQFRPYALACIIAILISGSISIFMAIKGFGVWALCFNLTAYSFFRMIFLWIFSKWYPKFQFSIKSIKKYFAFGVNLLLQGLFDRIVTNLESLVIGKVYTKQQLGYFSQGRKLDSYVTLSVTNIVNKVAYPVLSKVQNDENKLKSSYRKITGSVIFMISPIMCIMLFGAESIMNGIFGHQWISAAPYLQLWSICGWCLILYSIFINIFLVKGKSRQLLFCSVAKQLLRILCIIMLARISVMALMYGLVIATLLSALIYIYWGGKLISYSILNLLYDISPIILTSIMSGIFATFILNFFELESGVLPLILLSTIILIMYLLTLYIVKNKYVLFIFSLIRKK